MNRIIGLIFLCVIFNLSAQTKIPKRGFAVDWIVPAVSSNPTVKTFERIELGVNLPDSLHIQITNFLAESKDVKTLNPFEKKEIEIYAEFQNDSIEALVKINAIYHEDFLLNRTPDSLKKSKTKFRIHFCPNLNGRWKFNVIVKINGLEIIRLGEYEFTCESTGFHPIYRSKDCIDSVLILKLAWTELFSTSKNILFFDFYSFGNYTPIKSFTKDIDFANFKSKSTEIISKNKRVQAIIARENRNNALIGMIDYLTFCEDIRIFENQHSSKRKSQIQIEDLKKQKTYLIHWYNPFSGEIISTGRSKASKSGKMILSYPTLTKDFPFYIFKILEEY